MQAIHEKRLLQAIVGAACIVPVTAGVLGIIGGAAGLNGGHAVATDLESHFHYLSGILLAIGIAFASCVPGIETRGARFDVLALLVIGGGLARLASMLIDGVPSTGHLAGLGMELVLVPLLVAWRTRVARRMAASGLPPREAPHPLFSRKTV